PVPRVKTIPFADVFPVDSLGRMDLSRRDLFGLTEVPDAVERHRDDDEGPDEGALPERADAEQTQAVANYLDQGGADQRAERGAGAAGEIGPADDGRGDHLQLHAGAEIGGY